MNKLRELEEAINRTKTRGEEILSIHIAPEVFYREIFPLLKPLSSGNSGGGGQYIFGIPFEIMGDSIPPSWTFEDENETIFQEIERLTREIESIYPDWIINIKE